MQTERETETETHTDTDRQTDRDRQKEEEEEEQRRAVLQCIMFVSEIRFRVQKEKKRYQHMNAVQ